MPQRESRKDGTIHKIRVGPVNKERVIDDFLWEIATTLNKYMKAGWHNEIIQVKEV